MSRRSAYGSRPVDIDALVAIALRRLQLRRLLVAVERDPSILEVIDMNRTIKRPIELAGFAGRLARAERQEADLAVTGQRYDTVLADIDDQHAALKTHVGSLEVTRSALDQVIARMTAGSNGGPNDGGDSSSGSTGDVGQVITSETGKGEG
ncbi:hypothetical protein ACFLEY_21660 [Bradyrhizobium sp. YCK136]|uniref:Uncharacterized protein n=2 Tax=Bradyrhizobium diazoefficiens TaxID=1355477 RepID=A0A0E3VX00_9BRAD|nr:hypothetical protein [Bradyrhizobium diazoefficiens]BAR61795.1 hypothetical protein NK6_8646 [Bradyrhizobium diazoefficiens]BCE39606.1 hypothetical protein XF3B_46370 [Bradyrhizobium diazoefficiens]BCF53003.1 hypothetical protein XF17B_46410 [Bradyrhizobium diazoefficiens]